MKRIVLVRHATAEAAGTKTKDFGRSLRKKGQKEAKAMAEWYKDVAPAPDKLISSPANRAIETARIFARTLGYPAKKITQKKKLYGGVDFEAFLELLKSLDDSCATVMVFGHDPEFSEFASALVKGFDQGLPKSSVFVARFGRRRWQTLQPGEGELEFFHDPEGLRRAKERVNEIRWEVSDKIEKSVVRILEEYGIAADDKKRKAIRRASTRLAGSMDVRVQGEVSPIVAKTSGKPDRKGAAG